MALVMMPQADQFAVNRKKHSLESDIIDLTLDDSPPPPAKRHKPHDNDLVQKPRLPYSPASPSSSNPSRLTTPSTQLRDGAANAPGSGETPFKKPSPFRNRPPWSVSRNEGSSQAQAQVHNLKSPRPSIDLTDDDSPRNLSPKRNAAATTPVRDLSDHAIGKFFNQVKTEPLVFNINAGTPSKGSSDVRESHASQNRHSPANATVPHVLSDVKEPTLSETRRSPALTLKQQLPRKGIFTEMRLPVRTSPVLERPSITVPSRSLVSTPKSSQISVVIDNSGRKDLNLYPDNLLSKFQEAAQRSPRRQAVNEQQRALIAVPTSLRSQDVPFSSRVDDEIRKQKAQTKEKKVKRKSIKVDWGEEFKADKRLFLSPKDLISPKRQAQTLLNARFHDDEIQPSITFVNDVDDKQLSGKFQFITKNIRRGGIDKAPLHPRDGCKCEGVCRPDTCGCLVDDLYEDAFGQTKSRGKNVPYQRVLGPNSKPMSILRKEFMDSETVDSWRKEIVECDPACGCDETCWNRVVQHGRRIPLEIFMTAKCGFGLRSSVNILQGQFIDLYLGEIITTAELKAREMARGENAPSYIYDLDWWKGNYDPYHIDSLNFGTPTRFCNHSCDSNCRTFTVMQNRNDKKVYFLAFFASRDIPAGTELTIDYNPQLAGEKPQPPRPGESDVVRCHCGTKKCRMRLWPAETKKRKGRGWVNVNVFDDESDGDANEDGGAAGES